MELPKSVDVSRADMKQGDVFSFLPLIGTILGYKGRPNLLPYEYKTEKVEAAQNILLRLIAITLGVILATSFTFTKIQADGYKQRIKQVQFQRDILNKIREQQRLVDEREAFLKQVQAAEVRPAPVMRELSRLMPANVVLDWVRIDTINKTMDIAGVVIAPKAAAEPILTKFNSDIEKSRYFKEAQITSVQESEDPKVSKSRFEINFMFE